MRVTSTLRVRAAMKSASRWNSLGTWSEVSIGVFGDLSRVVRGAASVGARFSVLHSALRAATLGCGGSRPESSSRRAAASAIFADGGGLRRRRVPSAVGWESSSRAMDSPLEPRRIFADDSCTSSSPSLLLRGEPGEPRSALFGSLTCSKAMPSRMCVDGILSPKFAELGLGGAPTEGDIWQGACLSRGVQKVCCFGKEREGVHVVCG